MAIIAENLEQPTANHSTHDKVYVPSRQNSTSAPHVVRKPDGPVYCPTPISQLTEQRSLVKRKSPWSSNDTYKHAKQNSGASSSGYIPTPIHHLKQSSSKSPLKNNEKPMYSPTPINSEYLYSPSGYSPGHADSDTASEYDPTSSCTDPGFRTAEKGGNPDYNPTPQKSPLVFKEEIDIDVSDQDGCDDENGLVGDLSSSIKKEKVVNESPLIVKREKISSPEKRVQYLLSVKKVQPVKEVENIFDKLKGCSVGTSDGNISKTSKSAVTKETSILKISKEDESRKHIKKSKHKKKKHKSSPDIEKPAKALSNLFSEIFGDDSSPESSKPASPLPSQINTTVPKPSKSFAIRPAQLPKASNNSTPSIKPPGPEESRSILVNASGKKLTPREVMYNRMAQSQSVKTNGNNLFDKKISIVEKTSSKQKLVRPTIPATCGIKIPINIRQKYLNQFVDECIKVCSSEQESYARALDEEQQAYDKSANRVVYLNSVIRVVKRLREEQKELLAGGANQRGSSTNTSGGRGLTVSHAAVLGGAKAAQGNFGIMGSQIMSPHQLELVVKGEQLYSLLKKYLLTEEQLVSNGFPRPCEDKWRVSEAVLPRAQEMWDKNKGVPELQRSCCRCGSKFKVSSEGEIINSEECVYHWGKAWRQRVAGQGIEQRYNCCSSDMSQRGCQLASSHVHDANRWRDTSGYLRTLPPETPPKSEDDDQGVYALDCEMVYTTIGCELARVTVIDRKLESIYEKLVRPLYPVVDYNTRFSGLKEEDFREVNCSLFDIQSDLVSMFNEKTILMGHSLESDFIALKLIHSTVVDTSVVFPHRMGPPKKRALRNVVGDVLQRIIQADVGGHDSREDAMVCMELMQYKVKEDLKKKKKH